MKNDTELIISSEPVTTKMCGKCSKNLPCSAFNFKNKAEGTLQAYCKKCNREYQQKHYSNNIERYRERNRAYELKNKEIVFNKLVAYLKEHPCAQCGENEIILLDFDHLDANKKSFNLGDRISSGKYTWQHLLKEIQKCQVLCVACHRRKTAAQFGWKKFLWQNAFLG